MSNAERLEAAMLRCFPPAASSLILRRAVRRAAREAGRLRCFASRQPRAGRRAGGGRRRQPRRRALPGRAARQGVGVAAALSLSDKGGAAPLSESGVKRMLLEQFSGRLEAFLNSSNQF
jgi:hypothetical protein